MNTSSRPTQALLSLLMLPMLVACNSADSSSGSGINTVTCFDCGTVTSIREVVVDGDSTGIGAAVGAVLGGLAGNQVGGGTGKKVATVAGVVGGAIAGDRIEESRNAQEYYEVTIDMDRGVDQVITVSDTAGLVAGADVRVQDGNIILQ